MVSTIRSSARMRTKQRPACPSCSAQARGQTSHWIRPSSSRVHQVVGWGVVALTLERASSIHHATDLGYAAARMSLTEGNVRQDLAGMILAP